MSLNPLNPYESKSLLGSMDLIAEDFETSQFLNKLLGFLRQMIDCDTSVLFEYVHALKQQRRAIDTITAIQSEFTR